jgi:hypothetical protein
MGYVLGEGEFVEAHAKPGAAACRH